MYTDMKSTWLLCFMHLLHKNHSRQWSFPTQRHLTFCTCAVEFLSSTFLGYFCSLFSTYWTKFDAKMTKSNWNYTANMIMSVLGTVCQCIHYFPGKQGLAINMTWPALKVNNTRTFWFHQDYSIFKSAWGGDLRFFKGPLSAQFEFSSTPYYCISILPMSTYLHF